MATRTRQRARPLVVASLLLLALALLVQPAGAATVEVGTAIEAWYRSAPVGGDGDPICGSPLGCPATPVPPAPPYPEGTLHVGATAGRPDAVTYVAFATATLPGDVRLTGGTAVLPVAGTEDGTIGAESAELAACLLTEAFEPAEGASQEEAPAPDCDVAVPATYVGDGDVPAFEVDLTRFAAAWSQAGAVTGLALVPAAEGTGTWHVAFSGRERGQEGAAPPITAVLTYEEALPADGSEPSFGSPLFTDDTSGTSGSAGSGFTSGSSPLSSGFQSAPSAAPAVAAPEATGGADPAPQVATPETVTGQPVAALVTPVPYPYPVVWLLPLVLALGGVLLSRSLAGEVEVLGDDDERDLVGRLWLAFFPDRGSAR